MKDEELAKVVPRKVKYIKVGSLSLPVFWANLLFAFLAIAGQVGQTVTLPLWVDSTNALSGEPKVDIYFVVSFASLSFVIIFGLATLFLFLFVPGKIGETERNFPISLLAQVGICDALNGILVVFASSGTRTAPYLQAILGNFIIPLTILFRYDLLFLRNVISHCLRKYFLNTSYSKVRLLDFTLAIHSLYESENNEQLTYKQKHMTALFYFSQTKQSTSSSSSS